MKIEIENVDIHGVSFQTNWSKIEQIAPRIVNLLE